MRLPTLLPSVLALLFAMAPIFVCSMQEKVTIDYIREGFERTVVENTFISTLPYFVFSSVHATNNPSYTLYIYLEKNRKLTSDVSLDQNDKAGFSTLKYTIEYEEYLDWLKNIIGEVDEESYNKDKAEKQANLLLLYSKNKETLPRFRNIQHKIISHQSPAESLKKSLIDHYMIDIKKQKSDGPFIWSFEKDKAYFLSKAC